MSTSVDRMSPHDDQDKLACDAAQDERMFVHAATMLTKEVDPQLGIGALLGALSRFQAVWEAVELAETYERPLNLEEIMALLRRAYALAVNQGHAVTN